MPRFGFTQEEIDALRDAPIQLAGTKDVGVVLFHGWSSFPRQVRELAEALNAQGYWVSVPMLSGHGTVPEDLERVSWKDWLEDAKKAVWAMKRNPAIRTVVVGGTSMGGNLALLASQQVPVDGIVLVGSPVHLRNHFSIWLSTWLPSWIKKYQKKRYPAKIRSQKDQLGYTSYRYFPLKSVSDCLTIIRKSVFSLHKVTAPTLILQTSTDWLVAKYSPWVFYNGIQAREKQLQWLKSESGNHILISENASEFYTSITNFIGRVTVPKA